MTLADLEPLDYLVFIGTYRTPSPPNLVFEKLRNALSDVGFFPELDAEGRTTGFLGGRGECKKVEMENYAYPLKHGEAIDIVYVSRRQFGPSNDYCSFFIRLYVTISHLASPHGICRHFVETKLRAAWTEQPWWTEAFELFKNAVVELHKTFDCVHTIVSWHPDDNDLEGVSKTEFEIGTRPSS